MVPTCHSLSAHSPLPHRRHNARQDAVVIHRRAQRGGSGAAAVGARGRGGRASFFSLSLFLGLSPLHHGEQMATANIPASMAEDAQTAARGSQHVPARRRLRRASRHRAKAAGEDGAAGGAPQRIVSTLGDGLAGGESGRGERWHAKEESARRESMAVGPGRAARAAPLSYLPLRRAAPSSPALRWRHAPLLAIVARLAAEARAIASGSKAAARATSPRDQAPPSLPDDLASASSAAPASSLSDRAHRLLASPPRVLLRRPLAPPPPPAASALSCPAARALLMLLARAATLSAGRRLLPSPARAAL